MKELRIVGVNSIDIAKCLVNVRGDDFILDFPMPIYYPIKSITLLELKEEVTDDKGRLRAPDGHG